MTFELALDRGDHFTDAQRDARTWVFCDHLGAGCLAIHFKILLFREAEVLEALLTCHRDHVTFVDEQLGFGPTQMIAAVSTYEATTAHVPAGDVPAPAEQPFDRLRLGSITTARAASMTSASPPLPRLNRPGARTRRSWAISASMTVGGNIGFPARRSNGLPGARRKIVH